MEITKIYTAESSHRVPGATTTRCQHIHGHSYKFEISLSGSPINNACMVLDFSVLKDAIKPFVDSFDHCHMFCDRDDPEYVAFIRKNVNRWISAPFNWSCEMMALLIFRMSEYVIEHTIFSNGENPKVSKVKVWETATGSCTVTEKDVRTYFNDLWIPAIGFSDAVIADWPKILKDMLFNQTGPKNYNTKKVKEYLKMPGINA